jgi:hypothetical protein
MSDMRFRLNTALHEAGIANTDYARQMLVQMSKKQWSLYEYIEVFILIYQIIIYQSFTFLCFKESVPCILIVACSYLFTNNVVWFVRKAIQVLAIDDSFLDHFNEFEFFVVILIEVLFVFVIRRLLNERKISEVPYERLNHSHDNFLCIFIVEIIVNKDSPN